MTQLTELISESESWQSVRSRISAILAPSEPRSEPSLVDTCITQQNFDAVKPYEEYQREWVAEGRCPDGGLMRGSCGHGTVRWIRMPCKRRDCPVCGVHRRRKIAWRIAHGVEVLGEDQGGAWFVGTWAEDVSKADAVKTVAKFIRWLRQGHGLYRETKRRRIGSWRRRNGRKPTKEEKRAIGESVRVSLHRNIEYSSTWELQRRGVLHVNLILASWKYIPKAKLQEAWQRFGGGNVWIERVGREIGVETAKVKEFSRESAGESRQRIANYVGKWDQMVRSGRGVTYSQGWPSLPVDPIGVRCGDVYWDWVHDFSQEGALFWAGADMGDWSEVSHGEYKSNHDERCRCFERVVKREVIPRDPPDRLGAGDLRGAQQWLDSVKMVAANIAASRSRPPIQRAFILV